MVINQIASDFGSFLSYVNVQVSYTDLQATSGAGAQTLTISGFGGVNSSNALSNVNTGNLVIPANAWLVGIRMIQTTGMTGGSISAMTASLGFLGGSATGILAASNVFNGTAGVVYMVPYYAGSGVTLATLNGITSVPAFTPTITFTPTSDNCSSATAGLVQVQFLFTNISTTVSSSSYTPV